MESTDARRAFPCWDEPDRKAVFEVTLVVADGLAAFSNSPVVGEEPAGEGRRQLRFAPTMKMSTYLVAFVVGPLEATAPVDVDGVPVRVVHAPGKEQLAPYALEVAAHALRFFTAYFDLAYPADKLDLVAIPDFAFGAMENLGCVTFRETALLVDPASAARTELERVADVIAHEIAHMWFGDLVTMRWWEGIWLNEAFATFMEVLCVDAFRPAWQRWVGFGLERGGRAGGRRPPGDPTDRVPGRLAGGGGRDVRRPHVPEGRQCPANARAVPRARRRSATASATTSAPMRTPTPRRPTSGKPSRS